MKKYFLTGLALILPICLTAFIVNLLINLLTLPFLGFTKHVINTISSSQGWLYLLHSPIVTKIISQILVLLFIALICILIGILGRLFLINALFKWGDIFIHKIPFANRIYKSVQDVVHNVYRSDNPQFSKAVIVPFPCADSKAIGFITQNQMPAENSQEIQEMISVFVPGTPNPLSGFMLLLPKDKVTPIDLPFDDAVKFIASCGVIYERK